MSILYISPTGSGTRDGTTLDNAGTIASLSTFIAAAGPGGEVLLRADQGAYHLSGQVSIKAGGTVDAPITIRGVDANGDAMRAEFTGTRSADWTAGGTAGSEAFRLLSGADNLTFHDLSFSNVGNGAFRVGADIQNLVIEHVDATNVGRFIEDYASGTATSATIDGLTVRDVTVSGFSQGAIRLQYDTNHVLIENVIGDSQGQDGGLYVTGVHLEGTVHDAVLRQVTMSNCYGHGSATEYWNGDGFATEGGTYGIRFEDTVASGNTDAGYDLKSSDTLLLGAVSEDNNRNYRFWSNSVTMEDSVSRDPHHWGGSGSPDHVWMGSGAEAQISGFQFSDATQLHTLFDLMAGHANLYLDDTAIPDAYAGLVHLASGSNVYQTPIIGSNGGEATASVSIAENTSAVTTVTAADPDAGAALTYSIIGGADAAKFVIDVNTGELFFVAAPNFAAPTDAGGDNVYDVTSRSRMVRLPTPRPSPSR